MEESTGDMEMCIIRDKPKILGILKSTPTTLDEEICLALQQNQHLLTWISKSFI